MESGKRKAGRPAHPNASALLSDTIKIEKGVAHSLAVQAKKLKLSKGKFASAAIGYFLDTGLNPTAKRVTNLAELAQHVEAETRKGRAEVADVGNRLYALLRSWEKQLYNFLQAQQIGTMSYLERIEQNILAHQVAVESELLAPLIELVMKGGQDAQLSRAVGELIIGLVKRDPENAWRVQHSATSRERDQQLVKLMREFIQAHAVVPPTASLKALVPDVPVRVPLVPKAAASEATTATPGAATPAKT